MPSWNHTPSLSYSGESRSFLFFIFVMFLLPFLGGCYLFFICIVGVQNTLDHHFQQGPPPVPPPPPRTPALRLPSVDDATRAPLKETFGTEELLSPAPASFPSSFCRSLKRAAIFDSFNVLRRSCSYLLSRARNVCSSCQYKFSVSRKRGTTITRSKRVKGFGVKRSISDKSKV